MILQKKQTKEDELFDYADILSYLKTSSSYKEEKDNSNYEINL